MLQTTGYDEWQDIGEQVEQNQDQLWSLRSTLNSDPKTVWRDKFEKAEDGMAEFKDVLEARLFTEHPEQADTRVFYGPHDEE